jgi:hypothetical protein
MLNTYIFGAHAVLFVYDVCSSQSFENLTDWIAFAKKQWAQMEKVDFMTEKYCRGKIILSLFNILQFSHFIWAL